MKRDEKEMQLANPRYDFIPTVRGSAVLLVSGCVRGVCLFVCLLVYLHVHVRLNFCVCVRVSVLLRWNLCFRVCSRVCSFGCVSVRGSFYFSVSGCNFGRVTLEVLTTVVTGVYSRE